MLNDTQQPVETMMFLQNLEKTPLETSERSLGVWHGLSDGTLVATKR